MTKYEFLGDLSRFLSDLPEDERKQAMKYYEDYFADAGEEHEQEVIQELGTPKDIAKILLEESSEHIQYGNGTSTHMENQMEPYDSAATKDSKDTGNWQSSSQNTNEWQKCSNSQNSDGWDDSSFTKSNTQNHTGNNERDTTKTVLLVILIIVTSPIWFSIVTGILGGIVGIASAILGVFVALIAGGGGVAIGGVGCVIGGIIALITGEAATGILTSGIGCIMFSVGGLLCYLGIMLCIKFFPVAWQGLVSGFHWCSDRLHEIFR